VLLVSFHFLGNHTENSWICWLFSSYESLIFSHSLGFFGCWLVVFGQVTISSFVLLKFLAFWSGISLAPFACLEN
jgi:hypothetical protein